MTQYTKTEPLSNTPASPPSNSTHFFKLPYVGSIVAQNRLCKLLKRYCNDLDVKLAFSSFKIRNMFSVKDPVPVKLRSHVVCKFTCASCNSCYVSETSRHLSTCIPEHLNRDIFFTTFNNPRHAVILALLNVLKL